MLVFTLIPSCVLWLVNHVTLSFTDFDLEKIDSNCSHDAVEILDGDNYQAPSIGGYAIHSWKWMLQHVLQFKRTYKSILKALKHAPYERPNHSRPPSV